MCSADLVDENGELVNHSGDPQIDLCNLCQLGCKWREVAVRYLLSKRTFSARDGDGEQFIQEQKEVDREARRLYIALDGVLPDKLPDPPTGRPGASVGRIPRRNRNGSNDVRGSAKGSGK